MIEPLGPTDLHQNDAWRALEHKLRPFVARRVRGADVDDVVQDIFLRIQRGLSALRDEQRFGPWVYQLARSAIAEHGRAVARHPHAAAAPPEPAAPEPAASDERDVEREVAAYAAQLVSMLPSPYRQALTLTELEGLTQHAAAQRLGLSLSGMKSRVQRGRAQLRKALDHCCRIALDARHRVVDCEPRPHATLPEGCCAP